MKSSYGFSLVLHAIVLATVAIAGAETDPPVPLEVTWIDTRVGAGPTPAPKPAPRLTARAKRIEPRDEESVAVASAEPVAEPQAAVADGGGSAGSTDEKTRYFNELRHWIERRKYYPEAARRLGQTGTVEVRFKIDAEGRILDPEVAGPSPHFRLNEAALELFRRLRMFRPAPPGTILEPLLVRLPIVYRID